MMDPVAGGDVQVLPGPAAFAPGRAAAAALARMSVSRLDILVLGALGAAVSLALTGFQFGITNNIFHLPIVAKLYDEPQFANDAFIQALRYYSSGVWMLLEGSARYVSPYWLFLGLDFLSRLLSFVAFLCCGTLLGVETTRERAIFVVVLCFSSLLHGYSYPGNGGLFLNYFTHSEIANGTILLTFYFAARGRFADALALNGLTFFINAFMAIWTLFPLALIAAWLLWRRELSVRSLLQRTAGGLALAGILALPVLWNIAANPEFGAHVDFDFRRFLTDYYPDHVLFQIASSRHMFALAVTIVYGFVCLVMLGKRSIEIRAALLGSVLLYGVGIVLPLVTGQPFALNFHLIRSSTVIHLLVALASASLATKWLCGMDRNRSKFFGPLLVLADCAWRSFLPLGLVAAMAAEVVRRVGWPRFLVRIHYVVGAALVFVIWPRLALQDASTNRAIAAQTSGWTSIADWARRATPPDAVFLIPIKPLPSDSRRVETTANDPAPDLTEGSEIFEFESHRQVWVDFRRGAAVLWTPSYHATWSRRVSEVLAAPRLADKVTYARQHGIDYVIEACRDGGGEQITPAFRSDDLCVFPSSVGAGPSSGR
jgi:hypothetical protein